MRTVSEIDRAISVGMVRTALHLVTYENPSAVEPSGAGCDWTRLCGEQGCRFPRYSRAGAPVGLVSHVLVQLGYPVELLKELDREYETGEVLHPGVKLPNSRNAALTRLDDHGMALLGWLQQRSKAGTSWDELHVAALSPARGLRAFDRKRRPWLY